MDIREFLDKNGIEYKTEGKNVSAKWLGICCPFCNDFSFHGGIKPSNPVWFSCWRCGNFHLNRVISSILHLSYRESQKRIDEAELSQNIPEKQEYGSKPFSLPYGCSSMKHTHKGYLKERKFDPDILEREYNLLGTNHQGDYPHRIIAPIFFNGRIVSFQGRDITDKQRERYKACVNEKEIIHHKNILYNIDNAKKYKSCIVTEGITGVWRLGEQAVCTFGIKYTLAQAELLRKFKKILILFDEDNKARQQADKLQCYLETFNVEVINMVMTDGRDSGELTVKETKQLIQEINNL